MPSKQDSLGLWNSIAWGDISISFAGQKNYYIETGYKNQDGSPRAVVFGWQKDSSGQDQFFSQFIALGKEDSIQGPYVASVDKTRKALVTSHYAYSSTNDGMMKTYYAYDCRLSASDSDLLICGITLHIDASERSIMPDAVLALDNVMGGMELFKRVR